MKLTRATLLAAGLVALAGCGGGGNQAEVSGAVTYDGAPIDGAISFVGGGADARNAGAAIVDGKYAIPAANGPTPGQYTVRINWQKKTGKKFKSDAGEFDDAKEGLPPKYNDQSELKADIKPGKNEVNFALVK